MSDLKPCPFCGGEAGWDYGAWPSRVVAIKCKSCLLLGGWFASEQQAAAAWNTRAPCPECDRQRERANEAERRMDSMRQEVMTRYQLRAELAKALGVEQLTSNDQVEAALERVKALEAVAAAASALADRFAGVGPYGTVNITPLTAALAALDATPQQGQEGEE